MLNICFNFESENIVIQANLEDKMIDVINKYITKTSLDIENIYFLYNGFYLEKDLVVNKIISDVNRQEKKMTILVNLFDCEKENKKESVVISKETICPLCKTNIIMKIKDYKILLLECKNKHRHNNLFLEEYEQTQQIDEIQIKCGNCNKNNKYESYNNIFFRCFTCKKNLCPMCRKSHGKTNNNHNIINYDHKYYICEKHNKPYISYCYNCLLNTCIMCESEHNSHSIEHFSKIILKKDDLKKK
jgi:hypothetical protein